MVSNPSSHLINGYVVINSHVKLNPRLVFALQITIMISRCKPSIEIVPTRDVAFFPPCLFLQHRLLLLLPLLHHLLLLLLLLFESYRRC